MDDAEEMSGGSGSTPGGAPEPGAGAGEPGAPGGAAWERRAELGFVEALVETIRHSLSRPSDFFRNLPPEGPTPPPPLGAIGSPLLYALLVSVPALLVGLFWQLIASSLGILGGEPGEALLGLGVNLVSVAFTPLLVPISLAVASLVLHVFLLLLGGASRGLLATFRAVCYASGPELFQIVPFFGPFVSVVWTFVLLTIGLAQVHRTDTVRAFLAVLLPFMLLVGGILALVLLLFVAAGAAI